jgi:hypothetical protein
MSAGPGAMAQTAPAAQPDAADRRELQPVAVADRVRPAYDAAGVRAGSFILLPSLSTSLFYNDNVTASADAQSSFEYHLTPELRARSDWSRHEVEVYGGLDAVGYSDVDEFDHLNAVAGAKGRVDVFRDFTLSPSGEYRREFIQPGDASSLVAIDSPVIRDVVEGRLGMSKRFNRLWVAGGVGAADVAFDEIGGVDLAGADFLDYSVTTASARVGYDISPMTSVFTEVVANTRSFDDDRFDSDGWQMRAGVKFEASRLIHGEAYAGYLSQEFQSGEFEDISTYTFGGKLQWFASPLWTVTLSGVREAGESAYQDGSSLVISSATLGVDYEVLRNLVLSGSIRYVDNDYQDHERRDEVWQARASARYLLSRYMSVSLDYRYTDFDTSAVDVDSYEQNVYGATLRLQY